MEVVVTRQEVTDREAIEELYTDDHVRRELWLHKTVGGCDSFNLAAGRVMEKAGLVRKGALREQVY